jgi:oligopeptide/dipeptide ABC transporter ATP-binding protein
VKKYFSQRRNHQVLRAVDGVDFLIPAGETLGVVGESGCGKSTVARVVIGLMPATEGIVLLGGAPVRNRDSVKQRAVRRRTGIVFQDPYGSLDPRMTVADIVSEPLRAHRLAESKSDMLLRSAAMLESCGMRVDDMFKFPHQFSGGQRQRICIARALIAGPDVVVCDEAVSALDVSIQAQIINLLTDLREQRGLTYLFISHDLEVVRFIADRVAVMYLGKVVEMARKEDLYQNPVHPYTKILLESAPVFGKKRVYNDEAVETDISAGGEAPYTGCRFRPRCPRARDDCGTTEPELRIMSAGHSTACHFA